MKRVARLLSAAVVIAGLSNFSIAAQEVNPLFRESKVKNYLPHMSWLEVEQALQRTDMAIIPVGSLEQHGKHLPLGTDIYATIETCKLIAEKTDVLVAPVVLAGLSEHHMGFPGTITLSPATFEAVVFETAQSLIRHGVKKIMLYNGHGGNGTSVDNIVTRINQETSATAVLLNSLQTPPLKSAPEEPPYDWHAGEGETSLMLYLTRPLVDMSRAEKPVLTFPLFAQKASAEMKAEPNLELVIGAGLFRPKDTGKKSSTRELSEIGVVTTGDPRNATAARGKAEVDNFVQAAVKFIEAWKKLTP